MIIQAPLAMSGEVASLRGGNNLDVEAQMFEKKKQVQV